MRHSAIEAHLRERAEAMTTMLSVPQWQPSRSHVEALRNYMAEGAAEIARLRAAEIKEVAANVEDSSGNFHIAMVPIPTTGGSADGYRAQLNGIADRLDGCFEPTAPLTPTINELIPAVRDAIIQLRELARVPMTSPIRDRT